MKSRTNRREFLRGAALGTVGLTLAACGAAEAPASEAAPTAAGAASAAPASAAASAASNTSAAPVTLTMWSEYSAPPASTALDQIVALYNTANPDTPIESTKYENTPYETAIKAAYAGGEPPDIAEINGGADAWQYAAAGELADLTEFLTPLLPQMTAGTETDIRYQGKLWGVHIGDAVGNVIFYNKDILADNNIDVASLGTWSGFLAACEQLKQAGITPIAFGNKEGWNGDHWISHLMTRTYGVPDFEKIHLRTLDPTIQTERKFTDEPGVKAWQLYTDLLTKEYFSPGYLSDNFPAAYTYFFSGKAAFFQTGSWLVGTWLDQAPDFPLDVMMFPEIDGYPGKASETVGAGVMLCISERSQHQEQAKKFLEYWTTEEPNRIWAEVTSSLPSFKFDTASWELHPMTKKILDFKNAATAGTKFNDHLMDFEAIVETAWDGSQGVLSGDLTPEGAAERMETKAQELVEKLQG